MIKAEKKPYMRQCSGEAVASIRLDGDDLEVCANHAYGWKQDDSGWWHHEPEV